MQKKIIIAMSVGFAVAVAIYYFLLFATLTVVTVPANALIKICLLYTSDAADE